MLIEKLQAVLGPQKFMEFKRLSAAMRKGQVLGRFVEDSMIWPWRKSFDDDTRRYHQRPIIENIANCLTKRREWIFSQNL